MKFFPLFGSKEQSPEQENVMSDSGCPHVVLSPRWDSVKDMGHEDQAVGYTCTVCGAWLSLEEARHRRSSAA